MVHEDQPTNKFVTITMLGMAFSLCFTEAYTIAAQHIAKHYFIILM